MPHMSLCEASNLENFEKEIESDLNYHFFPASEHRTPKLR
jgi:hypothetical protein